MSANQERVHACGRDLHREQLRRFGAKLAWLTQPDLIPEKVTELAPEDPKAAHWDLAEWMVDRFSDWGSKTHGDLALRKAFEHHGLSYSDRVEARDKFKDEKLKIAYRPGLHATAEIHEVVPALATRERVRRESWQAIASAASKFGDSIARDGTDLQALVRRYLWKDPYDPMSGFDPAKLKLDAETGITTVTDINIIISTTRTLLDRYFDIPKEKVCVGLQAPSPTGEKSATIFDATWEAYNHVAARSIYPHVEPTAVPEATQPDIYIAATLIQFIKEKIILTANL